MPTADQYRAASARYRALGEQHLRHAAVVAGWPVAGHLGDGPVATTVRDGLDRAASSLARAADALAALASACDRRAAVCDEFRRAVLAHARLDPSVRSVVPRPVPPYPWVSA